MPCGVIHLSWPTDDGALPTYDCFVWLRGAYRNAGLGHTAVRAIRNDLPSLLPQDFR